MGKRWSDQLTILFGGTFDPPHVGHLEAVRGLLSFPGAEKIFVMPTFHPPLKDEVCSDEDRLEMTKIAFAPSKVQSPMIEVNPYEIENRPFNLSQPSYSFDTLAHFKNECKNLAFAIGTDQLEQLQSWYKFPEILDLCHWIVLERKPEGATIHKTVLKQWIDQSIAKKSLNRDVGNETYQLRNGEKMLVVIPTAAPAIDSSSLRNAIAQKKTIPENAIDPEVENYIIEKKLYGIAEEAS